MTANIVAYTQVDPDCYDSEISKMSSQEFMVYAARVSNPDNQFNHLTGPKLLRHCAKNAHWSVFDMVDVVIRIETTRDIGRQILRHWSFRFQEFSQRYADPTAELGFTTREARLQDTKNRQNSIETDDDDLTMWFQQAQIDLIDYAELLYKDAIANGIAKEQARVFLPEGLIKSVMFMKGSLRSWITYCNLRRANGTQKEHMEIAQECWNEILRIYPFLEEFDKEETK